MKNKEKNLKTDDNNRINKITVLSTIESLISLSKANFSLSASLGRLKSFDNGFRSLMRDNLLKSNKH